jgi:hypothetical protein
VLPCSWFIAFENKSPTSSINLFIHFSSARCRLNTSCVSADPKSTLQSLLPNRSLPGGEILVHAKKNTLRHCGPSRLQARTIRKHAEKEQILQRGRGPSDSTLRTVCVSIKSTARWFILVFGTESTPTPIVSYILDVGLVIKFHLWVYIWLDL